MKKLYMCGLTVLALGFTSCDDIEEGTGLPQTNPQLPTVAATNVTATPGPSAGSLISLDALNNDGRNVEIAKVETVGDDWPEGFTLYVPTIEVSKTADFSEFETVEASTDADGIVLVSPDAWEAAYREMYGKNPQTTKSYVRFPIWAVKGAQKVRMGGLTTYYGDFQVEVKPFDLYNGRIVEEEYYLLTSEMNWDLNKAIALHRTSPDMDVYVDGRFSSPTVMVNGAGFEWVIVPASAKASGSITGEYASFGVGSDNDEAMTGHLVANVTGSQAIGGLINETGPYIFNVNMEDLSYEVKLAYTNLYTPGNSNGWNFGGCQALYTDNYENYIGYAHLSGEFKFTTVADWNGVNFGKGAEDGMLSTAGDAANLSVADNDLYWCNVNLTALTYEVTKIATIGLIGDATPGGWDASTPLVASADFLSWSATVNLTEGEYKFRANDDWGINLGGSPDDLKQDGANIKITEAGTYLVTLDLSTLPYKATLSKQ